MRHLLAFAALLLLPAPAAHAQDTGLKVQQRPDGSTNIILPRVKPPPPPPKSYVLERKGADARIVGRLLDAGRDLQDLPPTFAWEGEMLVHRPTGVRLPKVHDGCRLAAIEAYTPAGTSSPVPYQRGARAEYDCRPAADLTYVEVVFEGGSEFLKGVAAAEGVQMGAARIASRIVEGEAPVSGTPCTFMDLKTVPGHVNRELDAAQCGVKWRKPSDPPPALGSAAYVLARGSSYVAFVNTCADPACATNRPKFGHFLDTFDLSSLKAEPAS